MKNMKAEATAESLAQVGLTETETELVRNQLYGAIGRLVASGMGDAEIVAAVELILSRYNRSPRVPAKKGKEKPKKATDARAKARPDSPVDLPDTHLSERPAPSVKVGGTDG
ncbi:MAG: hypothetical protein ABSF26_31210 [Thermoguttaceae bacterium]